MGEQATFPAMTEASQDDWRIIATAHMAFQRSHADRVLDHLRLLDGNADDDGDGFPVDRLTHSLQTATRAHRAGESEDYVVCALLHDIGDTLGSANHPDIAAAILKPYVSADLHWMVEQHGIFQGYYYFHHLGLDRDLRERFRGHPMFEATARFCELYDQNSFDAAYDTMPLAAFEPMMRRVFGTVKRSIFLRKAKAT